MKKKLMIFAVTLIALTGLTACGKTDVIGDTSIKSYEKVLNALPDQVAEDTAYEGWSLTSPDGEARFIWTKDFSKSDTFDALLEVNAQPFIDAGLDTTKLPEGMVSGDKLLLGTNFGDDSITYDGEATPLKSYEQIVKNYRSLIKYHASLDHYGVDLSNGNVFEWAKDMTKNDKDIVFALNPQTFIDAGVDPNKVEGWVFAKVETMDEKGKKIEVDKFLKPFDLDGKK